MLTKTQWWIIGSLSVLVLGTITFLLFKKNTGIIKSKLKNKNIKRILIGGDSHTAIKTAKGGDVKITYPNILMSKLPNIKFDVVALGGKTSKWLLDNITPKLKQNKYDRVYIYIGANDMSNSNIQVETTLNNIQKIVDLANENGADVFVNLGYKIEGTAGKFLNYKIMNLTKYVKKQEDWIPYINRKKELQALIPKTIKNANFIPVYDLNQNTTDGIHATSKGQKIVADKFIDSIENFK